ncbi:hypothetical protein BJY04DRAFT_136545 [Aspergillus karnatakaensis]|uniref:uncharacterized protein n=1 Tax=Aspergillus karnatakaensis TaxID=1810916 RepID=UPI003CCDF32E
MTPLWGHNSEAPRIPRDPLGTGMHDHYQDLTSKGGYCLYRPRLTESWWFCPQECRKGSMLMHWGKMPLYYYFFASSLQRYTSGWKRQWHTGATRAASLRTESWICQQIHWVSYTRADLPRLREPACVGSANFDDIMAGKKRSRLRVDACWDGHPMRTVSEMVGILP